MSVRIWCEKCLGDGTYFNGDGDEMSCPYCSGLGCIVKGCENCKHQDNCDNQIELWDEENYVLIANGITFCTAWEKNDGK